MGYAAVAQCEALFTYRIDPRSHNTETTRHLDSTTLRCYLKDNGHTTHLGQKELPELRKTIFISWGSGKPRIIETSTGND